MAHRTHHPDPVEGCFGCKVLGLGYDGHVLTKTERVVNENNGGLAGTTTEHRDGRIDAVARPDTVQFSMREA